jgi:hypothetical protein
MGREYANVFPDPVLSLAKTSQPLWISKYVVCWILKRDLIPLLLRMSMVFGSEM